MKLKRFNESSNSDENIDIIREAFYSITDEYPLEVEFEIIPSNLSYKAMIVFKTNSKYINLDDMSKESNMVKNILDKSRVASERLKTDLDFKYLSYVRDDGDTTIEVCFSKKITGEREMFIFGDSDPDVYDLIFFSYDEELFKKWFKSNGIEISEIHISHDDQLTITFKDKNLSMNSVAFVVSKLKKFKFKTKLNKEIKIFDSISLNYDVSDDGDEYIDGLVVDLNSPFVIEE